jgi:peptide/nickel transport system substrate-binding protein
MISPEAVMQDMITAPAGSGPYIPNTSTSTQTTVNFDRNDKYWDKSRTQAAHLSIATIGDDQTKLNALKSGEVDIAIFSPGAWPEIEAATGSGSKLKAYVSEGLGVDTVLFNLGGNPALQNPDVRHALSLAIDRPAISSSVLNDKCTATSQIFAPGVPGYLADADVNLAPDVDGAKALLAKALLAKAGVTSLDLHGLTPAIEPFQSILQVLQAQWGEIGVNLSIDARPPADVNAMFNSGQGDLAALTTSGGPSSGRALDDVVIKTIGGVPSWITDAQAAAYKLPQDGAEAKKIYEDVTVRAEAEPVILPICRPNEIIVASDKMIGADALAWSKLSLIFDPTTLGKAR